MKIIFHLDGTGIVYNPFEPIHIDALLAWCLAPIATKQRDLKREDIPDEFELPLLKHHANGDWCWQASALFPEGVATETLQYWRKRFRQNRIEMVDGNPNLTMGIYRDYNNSMPVMHALRMVGYASGNGEEIRRLLEQIKYLGKKRAYGKGAVTSVEVIESKENYSLYRDGKPMRWIPDENGTKFVRPRPPYWHPHGRTECGEITFD